MNSSDFMNAFFGGFNLSKKEETLNAYWQRLEMENYHAFLNDLKSKGYRVFRNKDGKHKVKFKVGS